MREFRVKLRPEGIETVVTETVNIDGKPQIELSTKDPNITDGYGLPRHTLLLSLTTREAESLARALQRAVEVSRKKHPTRRRKS